MAQFPLMMERPERLRNAAGEKQDHTLKLEAHGKLMKWKYNHLVYFLTTNYGDFSNIADGTSSSGLCSFCDPQIKWYYEVLYE